MRTHCDNNQPHAQVQPRRRILSRLENILNLTRPGIISLALVFCMLLTLLPASTVCAMAAGVEEVTIDSWDALVQKYGKPDSSDGITNIEIPQGAVVRATDLIEVGHGASKITGDGTIYANFKLNTDDALTIEGSETAKFYGTLTNEGTCNYKGGAIREIVNTGELTISGAKVGKEDLSDGSDPNDGFYTTIENKGNLTIDGETKIYNCRIDNTGSGTSLTINSCTANPDDGKTFTITNASEGKISIYGGEFHDIVIENESTLTFIGGTFYHARIRSIANGSVMIYSGTFQGEEGQPNSGSQIRCEGGGIGFDFRSGYSADGEAPKFINNECLDTSPIYILGMTSGHLCMPVLLKGTHQERTAEFLKITES